MSYRRESFLKLDVELSYSSRIAIALSINGDLSFKEGSYCCAGKSKADCEYASATERDRCCF